MGGASKEDEQTFESRQLTLLGRQIWVRLTAFGLTTIAFLLTIGSFRYGTAAVTKIINVIVAVIALLWEFAEFSTLFRTRRRDGVAHMKGMLPGIHIAFECFAWAGMLCAGALMAAQGVPHSLSSRGSEGIVVTIAFVDVVACIFHFTLFIWACVDVDRKRRLRYVRFITAEQKASNVKSANPMHGLPPPPPGMAYLVPLPGRENGPPVYLTSAAHLTNPQELGNQEPVELDALSLTKELDAVPKINELESRKNNEQCALDSPN